MWAQTIQACSCCILKAKKNKQKKNTKTKPIFSLSYDKQTLVTKYIHVTNVCLALLREKMFFKIIKIIGKYGNKNYIKQSFKITGLGPSTFPNCPWSRHDIGNICSILFIYLFIYFFFFCCDVVKLTVHALVVLKRIMSEKYTIYSLLNEFETATSRHLISRYRHLFSRFRYSISRS